MAGVVVLRRTRPELPRHSVAHAVSGLEQLEERERLRDRLAALGEMAAAIAHEVKNPLAGIEVMAGLLKRQLSDNEDAQSILRDIIKEAKMANAIVLEVLDFVRPIRLQVEDIRVDDVIRDAVAMADIAYEGGAASLDLHVSDGQTFGDDALVLNGSADGVPEPYGEDEGYGYIAG